MGLYFYIFSFFFGCFSTFFILKIGIDFLSKYLLDRPNNRSLHKKPVPRGGGLAFIIPLLIYDFLTLYFDNFHNSFPFSLLCLPLIIISFWDDLFDVPSLYRYIVQFSVSILIINFSLFNHLFTISLKDIFILSLLIIIITGIINFTNFMDGSDGLVVGCMLVLFLTLNIKLNFTANLSLLLGSLLIFLSWNWPPAKIFMGDVGSNFLGIYFAANLLLLPKNEILGLFLIGSPLFGDALVTLFRRFISGQNIFNAHRQHLYQRLCLGNLSKKKVCLIYISQSSVLSFTYLKFNLIFEIGALFIFFLIMYILDSKYALSFKESIKLDESKNLFLKE
tara:strand:- start:2327 stop:3331 length:1005 start_codon:yes stop_codon:yes gene_type:complete